MLDFTLSSDITPEQTIEILFKRIRNRIGVSPSEATFFTLDELKAIIKNIDPSWEYDSDVHRLYVMFNRFIPGWIPQQTKNTHPSRENLINILKQLSFPQPVKEPSTSYNYLFDTPDKILKICTHQGMIPPSEGDANYRKSWNFILEQGLEYQLILDYDLSNMAPEKDPLYTKIQSRAGSVDYNVVDEYVQAFKRGEELKNPLIGGVIMDRTFLAAGNHRGRACKEIGKLAPVLLIDPNNKLSDNELGEILRILADISNAQNKMDGRRDTDVDITEQMKRCWDNFKLIDTSKPELATLEWSKKQLQQKIKYESLKKEDEEQFRQEYVMNWYKSVKDEERFNKIFFKRQYNKVFRQDLIGEQKSSDEYSELSERASIFYQFFPKQINGVDMNVWNDKLPQNRRNIQKYHDAKWSDHQWFLFIDRLIRTHYKEEDAPYKSNYPKTASLMYRIPSVSNRESEKESKKKILKVLKDNNQHPRTWSKGFTHPVVEKVIFLANFVDQDHIAYEWKRGAESGTGYWEEVKKIKK